MKMLVALVLTERNVSWGFYYYYFFHNVRSRGVFAPARFFFWDLLSRVYHANFVSGPIWPTFSPSIQLMVGVATVPDPIFHVFRQHPLTQSSRFNLRVNIKTTPGKFSA